MKRNSTTGLTTSSVGAAFDRRRAGLVCGVTRSVTSASELWHHPCWVSPDKSERLEGDDDGFNVYCSKNDFFVVKGLTFQSETTGVFTEENPILPSGIYTLFLKRWSETIVYGRGYI